ncbi:hypothetical protein RclHR1_03520022 [Rhizophagus clarus]|uniref:Uncharacterized protein n=1 Tax=Rhizophagus clarus TaxID=94130 RepID=A0A2Z6REJ9_9GLOM|nr:hypothetical protein RclHR1_03520022 [Rhizophagus clarus]
MKIHSILFVKFYQRNILLNLKVTISLSKFEDIINNYNYARKYVNFVKLINKYKNNGVIKNFRCESFYDCYLEI